MVDPDEFLPNPDYWTTNSTPHGLLYLGVIEDPKVPVWGSMPHFLDCDPSLLRAVEGIRNPDRNLDNCIADIEPVGLYVTQHEITRLMYTYLYCSTYLLYCSRF